MSSSQSDNGEQSRELLQPILDVMGGADGGVAFSRLRHEFLPDMLAKAESGDALAQEFVLMVRRFSKLCEVLQGK